METVEFDAAAVRTYEENHGRKVRVRDITKADLKSVPDHDFIFGGFPCQTFSRNGKFYNKNNRTLGDDDRKNLVFYLLETIRLKRPSFFVFENVKELTTIRNSDGSSFLATLLDNVADLGYSVKWKILDSADFGLPQQRKRVVFVGSRDENLEGFEFPVGPTSVKSLRPCAKDFMDAEVPEKYLIRNLWRNRKNVRLPGTRLDAISEAYRSGKWRNDYSAPTGEITPVAIIYGDTPSGLPRQQDKVYSRWGISPTIATFSTPAFDAGQGDRILTPRECFRMQGFPETMRIPESDAVAYKQAGNAVSVPVIEAVVRAVADRYLKA